MALYAIGDLHLSLKVKVSVHGAKTYKTDQAGLSSKFCLCLFPVLRSRQCFSVLPSLSWNLLCRPGWLGTQKFVCLCLQSSR